MSVREDEVVIEIDFSRLLIDQQRTHSALSIDALMSFNQPAIRSRYLKVLDLAGHAIRSTFARSDLRRLEAVSPVARAIIATSEDSFSGEERTTFDAIERARASLYARTDTVVWSLENPVDPGSAPPPESQVVGARAENSSVKARWGRLLYALAREVRPAHCLELGSCMGVSGLYILAGLKAGGGGTLVTIEGSRSGSEIATELYRQLGFNNVEAIVGDFDRVLPGVLRDLGSVGLAFVDGNHRGEPTVRYDDMIRAHAADDLVIVHDDIRWSGEMRQAWDEVRAREAARIFDLFRFGVLEIGEGPPTRVPAWFGTAHLV